MLRLILMVALDGLCLGHIMRTGRDRIWFYVVIMLPIVGALIYIIVEIIPGMVRGPKARRLASRTVSAVDPARDLRRSQRNLEVADTVDNRRQVAEQHMALGRHEEALRLYDESATGLYADDPALLMGIARAASALDRHEQALTALERLRKAQPRFQSAEAQLIHAISLEGLGRTDEALSAYESLVSHATGEEARFRYARLLQTTGRADRAREVYSEIVARAARAPRRYRREQARWIDLARQQGGRQ